MQHTNTSSTSGGSTTSLFYRDLGARWLTTRSKKGIRRSNKNRLTLSKTPIFGWWRPAWNLSFEARVGILATQPPPLMGHGSGQRGVSTVECGPPLTRILWLRGARARGHKQNRPPPGRVKGVFEQLRSCEFFSHSSSTSSTAVNFILIALRNF